MKAAFVILLLTFLFFALPGHGQTVYFLDLVAEFDLAQNTVWDVQHWTSDSTYGWVTLLNDSITYCLDVDEAEVVTTYFDVRDSAHCSFPRAPRSIFIYASQPPLPPTVLIVNVCANFWGDWDIIQQIDLLTGQDAASRQYIETRWDQEGFIDEAACFDIQTFVWPPPPSLTSRLIHTYVYEWSHYNMSTEGYLRMTGGAMYSLTDTSNAMGLGRIHNATAFASFDSVLVVGSGYSLEYWGVDHQSSPRSYILYSHAVKSVVSSPNYAVVDTLCVSVESGEGNVSLSPCGSGFNFSAAQQNANGERRAFFSDGTCWLIEDGEFIEDWTNPAITGNKWTATMPDSPDERLLVHRPDNSFDVYNATDGSFLGDTPSMEGDFQYVLKQPGRTSEYVTKSGNTIRIYKPRIPPILTLTREFDAVRLRWNSVPDAASYSIYAGFPRYFSEPELFITTVTDTTYLFNITPALDIGIFTIRTNY